jgi:hypothetical protein
MKKLVIAAAALVAFSTSANAESIRLVPADGNPVSQLCIAAVESESSFKAMAKELGIGTAETDEVRCNGKSLGLFVSSMRARLETPESATVVFRTTDESDLSRLCMAIVESDAAYESVKASIKAEGGFVESEILCNGLLIKSFARKYRNMTASL